MHTRIEDFLERATEGLRDDEELRRETRAELGTHAEEKLRELTEAGMPEEEAIVETLKAMGETVELAGELHDANRGRMNLRARVRLALRFALVPAAVLAAAWAADWPAPLRSLRAAADVMHDRWGVAVPLPKRGLGSREHLVLYGDTSRETDAESQKAIWEAYPTNRVYFGNYFASTLASANVITNVAPELINTARTLDPDNALYAYLEACRVLGETRPSAEIDGEMGPGGTEPPYEVRHDNRDVDGAILLLETEEPAEDAPPPSPRYEVLDRDRLDRAMATFEQALELPHLGLYQMDMLEERLAILGPPERMLGTIQRVSMSAAVLLPDLQYLMELSRVAAAYGDLLLEEGDTERAAVFLGAWEPMAVHVLEDAGTLIEVLVAGATIERGRATASSYRDVGLEHEADLMEARVEAALGPLTRWKEARQHGDADLDETVASRGGYLAAMLIPALGESVPAAAFEPSRRLEYTVATEALVGLVMLSLFVTMSGCLLVSLRWRFAGEGRAIPLLIIPNWRELTSILGFGVLLPGAIFLLATRGLPFSGHAYAARAEAGAHKLVAEFGLLVLALTAVPAFVSGRIVSRRCEELRVPTTRLATRFGGWIIVLASAALVLTWCIPAGPRSETPLTIAFIAAGFGGLGLLSAGLAAFVQGLAGKARFGLYLGSLHRSLIPALAAAVVVLSLLSRPILYGSEARYIRQDTMFLTSEGGFTYLEAKVTNRLRGEMLAVLEGLTASR